MTRDPKSGAPRGDPMANIVRSADGTPISFDRLGAGPPLLMVVGAFNTRATTASLAVELEDRFTVLNYDRRGRGESGDTAPYSVEREIEDLHALIAEAGGSAAVFGYSSGANLALKAAARGLAITKLALYEPPFVVDEGHPRPPADLVQQLERLIADGARGDAVELFQTKAIGMPQAVVAQLRHAPFRPGLEQIAHTLIYDATIIGDLSLPVPMLTSLVVPTLIIDGESSPPVIRNAARAVAEVLANGRMTTLPGQGHEIAPDVTATVLADFLEG
jgi:pimeloyl-ACP methyl ester carboxylesterase